MIFEAAQLIAARGFLILLLFLKILNGFKFYIPHIKQISSAK